MIETVRETGVEVRLERHRARLHVPRAVFLLSSQQELDPALDVILVLAIGEHEGSQHLAQHDRTLSEPHGLERTLFERSIGRMKQDLCE